MVSMLSWLHWTGKRQVRCLMFLSLSSILTPLLLQLFYIAESPQAKRQAELTNTSNGPANAARSNIRYHERQMNIFSETDLLTMENSLEMDQRGNIRHPEEQQTISGKTDLPLLRENSLEMGQGGNIRYPEQQQNNNISGETGIPREKSLEMGQREKIRCNVFDINKGERIGLDATGGDDGFGIEVDKNRNLQNCRVEFPAFVEFPKDGDPGQNGTAFKISWRLSPEESQEREKALLTHHFNEYSSRMIAVHRDIGDRRIPQCKTRQYPSDLPSSSVIITFHNEAWTTLLRSIHSILDRTPENLIEEIILIDDFSTMDHLKLPLEKYLQPYKKVRLFRVTQRLGLIKARNLGQRIARSKIIIFLDSHIEVFPGWIEPLVAPIHTNPKAVTFPVIDLISRSDFHISSITPRIGSFDLDSLLFKWMQRRNSSKTQIEIESPTMPGGLYAISSDWFHQLGAYDPGLKGWGGENIEISFKVWMCGGVILTTSCSHVAHIFRNKSPLKDITEDMVTRNSARVAEVWMDSYKHFFYERISYKMGDIGDVKDRRQRRDNLQCNNFKWYLNNVLPELIKEIDENGTYCGEIRNKQLGLCLVTGSSSRLSLATCNGTYKAWRLSTDGKVICFKTALTVANVKGNIGKQLRVVLQILKPSFPIRSLWNYDKSQRLIERGSGLCLDVPDSNHGWVRVAPCTESDSQKWIFQTRTSYREYHKNRGVRIDWGKN